MKFLDPKSYVVPPSPFDVHNRRTTRLDSTDAKLNTLEKKIADADSKVKSLNEMLMRIEEEIL